MCSDKECPKNHIAHFTSEEKGEDGAIHTTKGATMHIEHHKVRAMGRWGEGGLHMPCNPSPSPPTHPINVQPTCLQNQGKWGAITIPLPPFMVEVLEVMERASHHLAPKCPTLIFTPTKAPYLEDGAFSQLTTALLSIHHKHATAMDMRHQFITAFEDYRVAHPEVFAKGSQVREAVARWMGNSTSAWAKAYDSKATSRAMQEVATVYPTFQEWVRAQARRAKTKRPRDPLE